MSKTITILLISFCHIISAQEASQTTELLNLAEIYKKNHVMKPAEEVFQKLGFIKSDDLQGAKEFIGELILDNNSIVTTKYLTKPDSSTLQNLYLVKMLTWNMFKGKSEDESY